MPKTQNPPTTPEELRAEAERLDAEAASMRQELQRQADEEYQRRRAAELAFDEEQAAAFSRKKLEADVDQAKAKLDEELAANPLVHALADYLAALRRRSHGMAEHSSALSRLGRPTYQPDLVQTELGALDTYVIPAAVRIATERVAAELDDLHARREAAGEGAAR